MGSTEGRTSEAVVEWLGVNTERERTCLERDSHRHK